jgi:ABC-type spermidine/putrescine transport system permease subunit I
VLAVIAIVVIPVGWLFYLSFTGSDGQLSFVNYQKMIEYKSYARTFVTTFEVSILTTLICILIGYPLAYFLAMLPERLAGFFMLAVLLPFWTSLLVRTYAWLVLLQKNGILNDFAMTIGLWDSPLKLVHNLTGTLIGMAHIMLPFLVLPLYGSMKKIQRDLMHAAANLGASPVQAFWKIYFPMSLSGMVAGSLIVFVLCLGFYVTPAVLGGGRVIMVATQITAILENQFDWGAASALGVVLLVVTMVILTLATKLFKLDAALFGKR